jgi:predicted Zn-dependent protease
MSHAFEAYTTKRDGNRPSEETLRQAETALNKALETARETAWAQVGASYVYTELRKVREADQAIRRAAQLDPNRVTSLTPSRTAPRVGAADGAAVRACFPRAVDDWQAKRRAAERRGEPCAD